jgi:hypothetical protein
MLRSALLFGFLAFSATAGAQGFDYNWLAVNYGMVDFDDVNVDGDGFGVDGSFAINEDFHVFGDYKLANLDFGVDATQFSAGIGYNTEMSPAVDAFARLSLTSNWMPASNTSILAAVAVMTRHSCWVACTALRRHLRSAFLAVGAAMSRPTRSAAASTSASKAIYIS